jgi:chromosome segregation ATPase
MGKNEERDDRRKIVYDGVEAILYSVRLTQDGVRALDELIGFGYPQDDAINQALVIHASLRQQEKTSKQVLTTESDGTVRSRWTDTIRELREATRAMQASLAHDHNRVKVLEAYIKDLGTELAAARLQLATAHTTIMALQGTVQRLEKEYKELRGLVTKAVS